jgi:hypothetical protein
MLDPLDKLRVLQGVLLQIVGSVAIEKHDIHLAMPTGQNVDVPTLSPFAAYDLPRSEVVLDIPLRHPQVRHDNRAIGGVAVDQISNARLANPVPIEGDVHPDRNGGDSNRPEDHDPSTDAR